MSSRQNLIVFVGGLVVAIIAVGIVTLLFPGKVDPIIGKWRAERSPKCDDSAIYFIVTKGEIDVQLPGKAPIHVVMIDAFETDGDIRRLRVHLRDQEPDFNLTAPYQVIGDTLTFGNVDWTPEARAKYQSAIQMIEAALGTGEQSIGSTALKLYQPYHRCPS
jgi:hypothetical protein